MSSGEVAKNFERPVLRGLLHSQIKRNLAFVFVSVTCAGLYMRFIFGDGNKRKYAEFYNTYKIDDEFERMRKKGLFDSCEQD